MSLSARAADAETGRRLPWAGRIEVVQALRFVAATAVVCVHLPTVGRGYWGVDLFFVVSGFVMCVATHTSGDGFLVRRLIRIVPLYWALSIGVFSIALTAPGLLQHSTTDLEQLAKSLLFIPFDKNGLGHYPVLFLGWTLNYEMIFYLLFAVALQVSAKNRALTASVLIFALFGLSNLLASGYPFVVYADPIMLEFCLGMLVYLLLARPSNWQPNALVAAAVVVGGLALSGGLENRVVHAALPCALLLYASVKAFGRASVPASLVLLGEASYALYLTHPYVIGALHRFGIFAGGGVLTGLASAIALAICFGVAAAVWLRVELPINRRLRNRLLRRPAAA